MSQKFRHYRKLFRRYLIEILAGVLFTAGIFGLLQQKLCTGGGWFNWSQFWHHEPLIALCFVAGIALIIGAYLGRR